MPKAKEPSVPPKRVLIADDHELFRRGLRQTLLDGIPGLAVEEAPDLDSALEALAQRPCDLVLLDLHMPGMAGGPSIQAIRGSYPATLVAIVSAAESRRLILDCLGAGAHGYVPKSFSADAIVAAARQILAGQVYLPASVARLDGEGEAAPAPAEPRAPPDLARLTPRQRDVLGQLAKGQSTKEIARALGLGEGTVKVHLAAVYRALGARNRMEAVLRASQLR